MKKTGSVELLTDSNGEHWFVVPKTDGQIIVTEGGDIRHRLSSFDFEFSLEGRGYYRHSNWGSEVAEDFWPSFSEVLDMGSDLYRVLTQAGCPLWSSEISIVHEWMDQRVLTLFEDRDQAGFLKSAQLCLEDARARDLRRKEMDRREVAINREWNRRQREGKAERAADRDEKIAARKSFESSPEYLEMFRAVYGKGFEDLGPEDPKLIVYHAKKVTEARLLRSNPGLSVPGHLKGFLAQKANGSRQSTPAD